MNKFVPFEKLSKKEKRRINNMQRTRWEDFGVGSPITHRVESKKKKAERFKPTLLTYEY